MDLFSLKDHPNTLTPLEPDNFLVVLHNLGSVSRQTLRGRNSDGKTRHAFLFTLQSTYFCSSGTGTPQPRAAGWLARQHTLGVCLLGHTELSRTGCTSAFYFLCRVTSCASMSLPAP